MTEAGLLIAGLGAVGETTAWCPLSLPGGG